MVLQTYPQYGQAVEYLKRLARAESEPAPHIDFVSASLRTRENVRPAVREPVPGLEAHKLRVVYRRVAGGGA